MDLRANKKLNILFENKINCFILRARTISYKTSITRIYSTSIYRTDFKNTRQKSFDFTLTLKIINLVKYKKIKQELYEKNDTKNKKLPVYNMLSISEFI